MPYRPPIHRPKGYRTSKAEADKHRPNAAQRGYGYKWQKARAVFLNEYPLCAHCLIDGLAIEATVVDHIIPHKGNQQLFWDESNWQSLCKRCHDIKTVKDDGGFGY